MTPTIIKSYTVLEWCDIFGIELVDNDWFKSLTDKITLETFLGGINECTIHSVNKERFKVFVSLTGNTGNWFT
jgi:hypothetical protein